MLEQENVLGIIVTDRDGVIKSLSHNNGVLNSSLIGDSWRDVFSIPVGEQSGIDDESPRVYRLPETKQKISVHPYCDEDGCSSGFHILVERMCEGEESAQYLNKVSCLEKIVPGIAHEINNPLAYVSGWLQMFMVETQDADPRRKTYEALIKEFERISILANSLLDFTRHVPGSMKVFDLHQVIEEVLIMIGYTMKAENIEIEKSMLSTEIGMYGDSNRLKQVFLNLMQNAREAMPDGGTMYLSTGVVEDDSVLIQFRDTGAGISKDQLSKIFAPFYTDRPDGNGTGLGLSVCKAIIEEVGGSLALDSKLGEGTVASVKLPEYSARD